MADVRGESTPGGPRVDELFQQAVAAQLAVQQAQRDSYAEFSHRLEVAERLMTDGLGAIVKVLGANDTALEGLSERLYRIEDRLTDAGSAFAAPAAPPEGLLARMDAMEAAVLSRLEALDSGERLEALVGRLETVDSGNRLEVLVGRLAVLEEAVKERLGALRDVVSAGLDQLSTALAAAGGRYEEGLEDAKASREALQVRLVELEGSVRKFEEQTVEQLSELREASTAAEAGILERIILESQTVASHFETVRPAVEAAVQAAPELETTLSELRELAERAIGGEPEQNDSGPYSAEELLAPHEDEQEGDPLFQPPEETKIPERRFLRRDR